MMKINKSIHSETMISALSSLISIVVGLIFGFVILLIADPAHAVAGFGAIVTGAFNTGISGFDKLLYLSAPIIMTGLSVGFAFKTGLFNIGASGQFMVGACAAMYVGNIAALNSPVHWLLAVIAAMLAGAFWGLIPGLLKAYLNVNEVIATIMLNYIGIYGVNMIVRGNFYDMIKNQSSPVEKTAYLPKWFFDELIPGGKASISILIAILAVVVVYVVLQKTTFGYELKAVGKNREATKYAGIIAKRNIVLAMVIAGSLSGIGGSLIYLAEIGKYWHVVDVISPEGFTGIAVALLGVSNPVGIFFSGLFIEHITLGGVQMQLYNYAPEVIDIIISAIIYCGALSLIFKSLLKKFIHVDREDS